MEFRLDGPASRADPAGPLLPCGLDASTGMAGVYGQDAPWLRPAAAFWRVASLRTGFLASPARTARLAGPGDGAAPLQAGSRPAAGTRLHQDCALSLGAGVRGIAGRNWTRP